MKSIPKPPFSTPFGLHHTFSFCEVGQLGYVALQQLTSKVLSRWWPWLQKLPSWKMKDLKNQFIYKTHVIHVFLFFFSCFSYLVAAICFSVHFCARSSSTCQNGGHSLSEVYHHVQIILSQLKKKSLHSIWGKVQKKSSRRFLIDNKLPDNLAASSLHQVLLMLSTEVQRCACSTAGVARWWTNPLPLYLAHPSATERSLAGCLEPFLDPKCFIISY